MRGDVYWERKYLGEGVNVGKVRGRQDVRWRCARKMWDGELDIALHCIGRCLALNG